MSDQNAVPGLRPPDGDSGPSGWVPVDACTLPTAEQPLRVAEFDELFATSVRRVVRTSPTSLLLDLAATAEDRAHELAARESACCDFFMFTFTPGEDGTVRMGIDVPPGRAAVLDGLAGIAQPT